MKDMAIRENRTKCLLALISALVVVVCVCIGVTMNLTTLYDENFDHMGLRTFCMFTVNSNIIAAVAMALCLPYTIDGLRTNNYHLPNWIVDLIYTCVTAVALTFLISLFVLSPVKGFVLIFTGSRFFLHGLCPILSILAFCFFITDHRIRIRESFYALIPVLIYASVYTYMVLILGQDNGGWEDFYEFFTRLPVWVPLVFILPLTYGIATGLRLLHNGSYERRRSHEAEAYRKAYGGADVREVVREMALAQSRRYKIADIVTPVRVIQRIIETSGADVTLEECCLLYQQTYLENMN